MIVPSLLPVLSPIILYFVILSIAGIEAALVRCRCHVTWGNYYRVVCSYFNDCRAVELGIMPKSILKMEIMVEKVQMLTKPQ
jgi:hypothetical protein